MAGFSSGPIDDEIKNRIWEGSIPIVVELDENEVSTLEPPMPLLLQAPRCSYLQLLSSACKDHFGEFVPDVENDENGIWFDFSSHPLKWNIPIGVLFDLQSPNQHVPWNLTVHFRNFPKDDIIPCSDEDVVKWNYINTLKESDYLKHGSTKAVMGLSNIDENNLWQALKSADQSAFWSVHSKFCGNPLNFKHFPIRVYLPGQTFIQHPVSCSKDDPETKFIDILREILPTTFPIPKSGTTTTQNELQLQEHEDIESHPQSTNDVGSSEDNTRVNPVSDSPHVFGRHLKSEIEPHVVLHGICPDLEIPVRWLWSSFMYPDNFLHIVVFPDGLPSP